MLAAATCLTLGVRQPCSIPQVAADLPSAAFNRYYRGRTPVVIANATRVSGARFRALTQLDAFVESYGHLEVTLSSANAHSYGRKRATVRSCMRSILASLCPLTTLAPICLAAE